MTLELVLIHKHIHMSTKDCRKMSKEKKKHIESENRLERERRRRRRHILSDSIKCIWKVPKKKNSKFNLLWYQLFFGEHV